MISGRGITQIKAIAATTLPLAITLHYFALRYLEPYVKSRFNGNPLALELILLLVTGTGIYSTVVFLPIALYERWLWRMFNRAIDFNGYWNLDIEYTALERPGPMGPVKLDCVPSYTSIARVHQTLYEIQFRGISGNIENWNARSIQLNSDNTIIMVYEITRSIPTHDVWPIASKGVEEITVDDWNIWGRPVRMHSEWHHCALPDRALYRGTVRYRRIRKKDWNSALQKEGGWYAPATRDSDPLLSQNPEISEGSFIAPEAPRRLRA